MYLYLGMITHGMNCVVVFYCANLCVSGQSVAQEHNSVSFMGAHIGSCTPSILSDVSQGRRLGGHTDGSSGVRNLHLCAHLHPSPCLLFLPYAVVNPAHTEHKMAYVQIESDDVCTSKRLLVLHLIDVTCVANGGGA